MKNIINKNEFLTVPNILSYFRIILIPIWIWSFNYKDDMILAFFIFVISGLTDAIDGYIARKFNLITQWGKIIDPVADKLTQLTITICLAFKEPLMWYVVILFIVKDTFIAIGGFIIFKKDKSKLDGAKWYGKLCTAVFYIIVGIMILFPRINYNDMVVMVWAVAITILLAFILYIKEFTKINKKNKNRTF